MALGRDADRVIIIELGRVKVFSDIHGRHAVRLDNDFKNRQELANRLKDAGCAVKMAGTSWHNAGDLTPPAPPGAGLPMGRKLPSSQTLGHPRLAAQYIDQGPSKFGLIKITNNGPGDAYEATSTRIGNSRRTAMETGLCPSSPPGTVSLMFNSIRHLGGGEAPSYATVTLSAKTADGVQFTVEEFVSGL